MIYCPKCGIANREGSRFCNDCGTKLPSSTSVHCPQCGTPNPPNNVFCEQCNARLVPTLADETPEAEPPAPVKKGLSLPTKPASAESTPATDWLGQLRSSMEEASESDVPPEEEPAASIPDWLARLNGPAADSTPTEPAAPAASGDEVPDWLTSLGIINPTEPSAPAASPEATEWLNQTPPEAPLEEHPPEPEPAEWISSLREETTPAANDGVPDWLRELGTAPLKSKSAEPPPQPTGYEEEIPDWLQSLGTGALVPPPSATEPASVPPSQQPPSPPPPAPAAETPASAYDAEVPDWLRGLGTGILKPSEPETPAPSAESLAAAEPWLKALRAAAPQPQEDIPDWLQNLGTGALTPPEETAAEAAAESAEDVPEWLRNLGTGALTLPPETPSVATKPIEPATPAAEPAESAAPEDWLSALRAATPPAVEAPLPEEPAEELPDWLKGLGTGALSLTSAPTENAAKPIEPAAPAAEPSESVASEDWLGALRAATLPADEAPLSEEPAEELPDWLRGLSTGALSVSATPTENVTEPIESAASAAEPAEPVAPEDWLGALRAATPEIETPALEVSAIEEPAVAAPAEAVEAEVPEWLQGLGAEPNASAEEVPTVAEEASVPVVAPAEQSQPDTDDWMSALRAAAPLAEEEPAAEEASAISAEPQAEAEVPDWLSGLRATVPPFEPESQPGPSAEADEVPDWLREAGAAESAAETPISEVPDWLTAEPEVSPAETPAAEPEPIAPSGEEVPDWLRDFGVAEPVAAPAVDESEVPEWLREATPAPVAEAPAAETSEAMPVASVEEELPDWLREAAATQPASLAEIEETPPSEEPSATAQPATEIPEWLADLRAEPTAAVEPRRPEPVRSGESTTPVTNLGAAFATSERNLREAEAAPAAELPDWLKSLRAGQPAGQPAVPSQSAEPLPGLTQAEIPSWLEALRPKEGAAEATPEGAEESETEGVLAGLAHLLPAVPSLNAVQGAAASLQVEPSADDLARAGIFQELLSKPISAPTQVGSLPSRALQMRRSLTQVIVAVVFLIVAAIPFLVDERLPFLPLSDTLPASPTVQSAVDAVANLPSSANVLVVFDYDGTQAGEMDQIASIILRHLKGHGATVTVASLNPQGTSLAQSVWESIGLTAPPAIFVPGQAVGIQSLMLDTGPYDLVIDLSATADNVRWWVEQIAVNNWSVKFVAGVSAGAEPLALPYAQSKQIAGLVSGAVGALQYARQAKLLPTVEEALQAAQVSRQTSLDVVTAIRGQLRLESQTLAHWVMIGLIVLGLIGGLVTRGGRRSA
ncbi:MAG: zinc-ribbon domain-containing protein [Anaerolineae bacterium]